MKKNVTDNPAYKGESDCKIEEYSSQKSIEIQTSKDNWKKADKYHEHGIRKPPEGKKKRIFYKRKRRLTFYDQPPKITSFPALS